MKSFFNRSFPRILVSCLALLGASSSCTCPNLAEKNSDLTHISSKGVINSSEELATLGPLRCEYIIFRHGRINPPVNDATPLSSLGRSQIQAAGSQVFSNIYSSTQRENVANQLVYYNRITRCKGTAKFLEASVFHKGGRGDFQSFDDGGLYEHLMSHTSGMNLLGGRIMIVMRGGAKNALDKKPPGLIKVYNELFMRLRGNARGIPLGKAGSEFLYNHYWVLSGYEYQTNGKSKLYWTVQQRSLPQVSQTRSSKAHKNMIGQFIHPAVTKR